MHRGVGRPARLGAGLAVVVVLAGCTTSEAGHGGPGPVVVAASAQHGPALIAAARSGMEHVMGVEAEGTLRLGGTTYAVDVQAGYDGGHGTLSLGGSTVVLDLNGTGQDLPAGGASGFFITAPAAFWLAQGVDAADATQYDGHQVAIPQSSNLLRLTVLLNVSRLTTLVFVAAGPVHAPTVTASPPVDGQQAWVVELDGRSGPTMTVQQAGQQFPLRLRAPGVALRFGQFNVEPRPTLPDTVGLALPG